MLLAAEMGNVNVVCQHGPQPTALVLGCRGDARVVKIDSDDFQIAISNPRTLYLYDPAEKETQLSLFDPGLHGSFNVVAASPDPSNYGAPYKNGKNLGCHFYHTDMWNTEELMEGLPIMLRDGNDALPLEPSFSDTPFNSFNEALREYYRAVCGTPRLMMWKFNSTCKGRVQCERDKVSHPLSMEQLAEFIAKMTAEDFNDLKRAISSHRDEFTLSITLDNVEFRLNSHRLITTFGLSLNTSFKNEGDFKLEYYLRNPTFCLTSRSTVSAFILGVQFRDDATRAAHDNLVKMIWRCSPGAMGEFFEHLVLNFPHDSPFQMYTFSESRINYGQDADRPKLELSRRTEQSALNCPPKASAAQVVQLLKPFVQQLFCSDRKFTMAHPSDPSHEAVDAYHIVKIAVPKNNTKSNAKINATGKAKGSVKGNAKGNGEDDDSVEVDLCVTLLQVKRTMNTVDYSKAATRVEQLKREFMTIFAGLRGKNASNENVVVRDVTVVYCYAVSEDLQSENPFTCSNADPNSCFAIVVGPGTISS